MSIQKQPSYYLSRRQFLGGALGFSLGLLSGCTGTTEAPTDSGNTNTQSSGSATQVANNKTATLAPLPTDHLRIGVGYTQTADTLDPYSIFSMALRPVMFALFDGLVAIASDGSVVPKLAQSWHRLDELRVQFKLRARASFHNGETVNAQAVKFSIERALNPNTAWPGLSYVSNINGVEIVDDYTLNIRTQSPDALLVRKVAYWFPIQPPAHFQQVGAATFGQQPVGSGPFKFSVWLGKGTPRQEIKLIANEDYWAADSSSFSKLTYFFMPLEAQQEALFNNQIDVLTALSPAQAKEINRHPNSEVLKQQRSYATFAMLNIDKVNSPLATVEVRHALNYAVNKKRIRNSVFKGNATSMAGLIPANTAPYNPALTAYEQDVEKASALMAQAGYADGFTLSLLAPTSSPGPEIANALKTELTRLNISLEINLVQPQDSSFLSYLNPAALPIKEDLVLISGRHLPDIYAAGLFQANLLYPANAPFNPGLYRQQAESPLNPLFEAALSSIDSADIGPLYIQKAQAIEQFIHQQALGVFLFDEFELVGVRKGVTSIYNDAEELSKILYSILKTTRKL